MENEKNNGAVKEIRELFVLNNIKRTLPEILIDLPHLNKYQVAMALNHLFNRRWVSRELIPAINYGRKEIYQYTYHKKRLPHPDRKPLLIAINPIEYYANATNK